MINIIDKARVIISNPGSLFGYFGWPTAKKLQNGKIAVASSGFRLSHICPFGKTVISYSEDGGKTYTRPAPVIDTILDDRDGGLCTFGKSGLIVTSFNNRRSLQRRFLKGHVDTKRSEAMQSFISSYLDCITDEAEDEAIGSGFVVSEDCGVTFGNRIKSPVTSPHGPIELSDGTVLWVGTVVENEEVEGNTLVEAHRINPDGTMEKLGTIDDVYVDGKKLTVCEPYAIELSDGTIICHIRMEPEFSLFQTVSYDKGYTWSEPKRVLPAKGGAPSYMLEHSSGVLIAGYSYREEPFGIKVMFSYDKGKSWSEGEYIYKTNVSADLGYPTMIELDDKSILTVFYAHEKENEPAVVMQTIWSFDEAERAAD